MVTIFLSSTFNDMQRERDSFHKEILRKVNDSLKRYGQVAQLCDLRWGIDTDGLNEEESTNKILKICFSAIETSAPYFVVMLGDRYGWIPDKYKDSDIEQYNISYHRQSVTEMEIEYNSIISSEYGNNALYFFRKSLPKEEMTEENKKVFFSDSEESDKKLDALKNKIRAENPGRVIEYSVNWLEDNQDYNVDSFTEIVSSELIKLFDEQFRDKPILSWQEEVINESRAYMERQSVLFGENYPQFSDCVSHFENNFLSTENDFFDTRNHSFTLIKEQGVDDSWISSFYMQTMKKQYKINNKFRIFPIPFVAGINANAINGDQLLSCIITEIEKEILTTKNIKWIDGEDLHAKVWELFDEHSRNYISKKYIVERSRNRFYLGELYAYALRECRFVPFVFVAHMEKLTDNTTKKLLFTASDSGHFYWFYMYDMNESMFHDMRILRAFPERLTTYKIKKFTLQEKTDYIRNYFSTASHELSSAPLEMLIEKSESHNPSWLKIACDNILQMDRHDFERVRALGDGIDAINQVLCEKIEKLPQRKIDLITYDIKNCCAEINRELSEYIISIISLSEHGVTAKTIEKFAELLKIQWSSLDFELLTRHLSEYIQVQSNGLIRFFDREVADYFEKSVPVAVKEKYIEHLKSLDIGTPEYASECFCVAMRLKDAPWTVSLLSNIISSDDYSDSDLKKLFDYYFIPDDDWLFSGDSEIPECVQKWFAEDFLAYTLKQENAENYGNLCLSFLKAKEITDYAKMFALEFMSEIKFVQGNPEESKIYFTQAFSIAETLKDKYPVETLLIINCYINLLIKYKNTDEIKDYADIAYNWAESIPLSIDTHKQKVFAGYNFVRIYNETKSVETICHVYQNIIDMYYSLAQEICFRPLKQKDWLSTTIKDKYRTLLLRIYLDYAEFLSNNANNVPDSFTVKYTWPEHINPQPEDPESSKSVVIDRIELHEDATFLTASNGMFRDCIMLLCDEFDDTNEDYWLFWLAYIRYRLGMYQKKIGFCEDISSGAYDALRYSTNCYIAFANCQNDFREKVKYMSFAAENLKIMGDIASKIKLKKDRAIGLKSYYKSYNLYKEYAEHISSDYQLRMMATAGLKHIANIEDTEKKATMLEEIWHILSRITKKTESLYYCYYSWFWKKSHLIPYAGVPIENISGEQLNDILFTQLFEAKYKFYNVAKSDVTNLFIEDKNFAGYFFYKPENLPATGTDWEHSTKSFAYKAMYYLISCGVIDTEVYKFNKTITNLTDEQKSALKIISEDTDLIDFVR